ncbi:MAG: IS110 family transposase [Cytophagales bacterium]|nr:IS110 family transposase [Cytophagales bacterium]
MNNKKYFIGIDLSKHTLDIAINKEAEQQWQLKVSNDLEGMKALEKKAKALKVDLKNALFCLEYTGVYKHILGEFLSSKKYDIWVENPVAIKSSLGLQRGKNDKIDAKRIAQYAYRFQDKAPLGQPERAIIQELRRLTTLPERLIKISGQLEKPLTEEKNFMPPASYKIQKKSCKQPLKALKQSIEAINKQIKDLIYSDEKLKHQHKLVTSVHGVGSVTACQMRVSRNEFTKIKTGKKFGCYSGVARFEFSSGSSIQGRHQVSDFANKSLKSALHMASLSAIQMKGELQEYYQRQVDAGTPKMSVLNAVRNKLLQRVCAFVRANRMYEPEYVYKAV